LDYRDFVTTDPRFYRPAEVDLLLGDCRKAQQKLGWTATCGCDQLTKLVREMMENDPYREAARPAEAPASRAASA